MIVLTPRHIELIKAKALLVLWGYPTQGVTLADLVDITIELCEDDFYHPSPRTVKAVIQAWKPPRRGRRYFHPDYLHT